MALGAEARATALTHWAQADESAALIISAVATGLIGTIKKYAKKCRKNLQVSDKTTTFAHAFEKQCLAIRAIPLEGWVSG